MIILNKKIGESLTAEMYLASSSLQSTENIFVKKVRKEFASRDIKKIINQQIFYLQQLKLDLKTSQVLIQDKDENLLLVSPYIKGIPLSLRLLQSSRLNIKTIIHIAIQMVKELDLRHKAAFLHKGISPSNIFLIENNNDKMLPYVKIIHDIRIKDNFSFSRFIQDKQYCRETLPYLSPEQTGRIRCDIGYSSDLYSVGTLLYECVTGFPPFYNKDPIAIIHSHLAEVPKNLQEINPSCPDVFTDIISILLKKEPERRYLSTKGLLEDLVQCQQFFINKDQEILSNAKKFVLKQKDHNNHISIPSIMVGRDKQKKELLNEYLRVCNGKLGIAFITGLSGMGKTRLIQELERPIVSQRGYYTSGKFNQYNKHLPYSTLIEALDKIIRQILSEDKKRVLFWKNKILNIVGENGQLVIDLVPGLELLIGKQKKIPSLPPADAQERFKNVFSLFLAGLASKQHPLVLFIDDLQWCDNATFDLIELIVKRKDYFPYFFLIGAYRNNEVNKFHRVHHLEKLIQSTSLPLVKLHVNSLNKSNVNEMIAFILNTTLDRTSKLADTIYPVSAGNPLFVNESLRWLHKIEHLFLNKDGIWQWNEDALSKIELPQSAKALFCSKLNDFSKPIVKVLATASLLGADFQASDLSNVENIPIPDLYLLLKDVFAQRILLQDKTKFRFFHDQIQAAAASFLNDKQKQLTHKKIANTFINIMDKKEKVDPTYQISAARLFLIVEHLAAGHSPNMGQTEIIQEATFNFKAGNIAMDALALDACDHYFKQSVRLCPEKYWNIDYKFMFILHQKYARAALMNGDQKRSNEIVSISLKYAKNDIDRAECLYEQTVAYTSFGDVRESITLATAALRLIGEVIPTNINDAEIEFNRSFSELLNEYPNLWQDIVKAPDIHGRNAILELNLYGEILVSYYMSGQMIMFTLIAVRILRVSIKNGVCDFSCFSLCIMAFYLQLQNKMTEANRSEDAMTELLKRFPNQFGSVRAMTASNWLTLHSRRSASELASLARQTMEKTLISGEMQYTGYAKCPLVWILFLQGNSFNILQKEIDHLISFGKQFNLAIPLASGEAIKFGLHELYQKETSAKENPQIIIKIERWKQEKHSVALASYYLFNGIAKYFTKNYDQSIQSLDEAKVYLNGITNTVAYHMWPVFHFLTSIKLKKDTSKENCLEKVTTWAEHAPIFRPYLALMKAEEALQMGDSSTIKKTYTTAINEAKKHGFTFLHAHINESMSDYLKSINDPSWPKFTQFAKDNYLQCQATFKINTELNNTSHFEEINQFNNSNTLLVEKSFEQSIDYNYLLNSVKAITQEQDLNKLLKIIIESVMSRMGARTSYLLIAEENELFVTASAFKNEKVHVQFSDDVNHFTDKFSIEIARYVFRTGKTLTLGDALKEGDFKTNNVVLREQLRSIACFPFIKGNNVLGVFYLENNLIKSVFSNKQIQLAHMLISQGAIALENSLLMHKLKNANESIHNLNLSLEKKVKARTTELEYVNNELQSFAYAISHDLKAPLRGITQLSTWLIEDNREQLDNDGINMLDLLKKRAKQMHDMIDGVLAYSRVGQIKAPSREINLNHLVINITNLLALPQSLMIEIKGILPTVKYEETLLFQVFQNLIDNAAKYMQKRTGNIQVSCIEKEHHWQFCVADDGPGIDKMYHQKIFKIFQTLKSKDESNSTGIGLALVSKVIQNWGGKIWVESENGNGSQFYFNLPKKDKQSNEE